MKRKSKHSYPKKKKEFRFKNIEVKNNDETTKIRHPAYIIVQKGNVYIYVTLTHSSSLEDKIVIELRKNPNPSDSKKSYYIAEIKEDLLDKFGKKLANWYADELDDKDIRQLYKKDGSANQD